MYSDLSLHAERQQSTLVSGDPCQSHGGGGGGGGGGEERGRAE